jgi:hypothetical protein
VRSGPGGVAGAAGLARPHEQGEHRRDGDEHADVATGDDQPAEEVRQRHRSQEVRR